MRRLRKTLTYLLTYLLTCHCRCHHPAVAHSVPDACCWSYASDLRRRSSHRSANNCTHSKYNM